MLKRAETPESWSTYLDLRAVAEICSTMAVMNGGKIVEYGAAEAIYANPKEDYTRRLIHAVPNDALDNIRRRQADRLEAARLLAALEVHAERRSLDEAISAFQRRTGFDRMTADHEVRGILHDPLRGCSYLGYLRFVQLDERLRAELEIDRNESLELISRQLIELPFAPTAVLEEGILSARNR